MRIEELKKRNKIISKFGSELTTKYENYKEGSLVLSIIALLAAGVTVLLAGADQNYWLWGVGLTLFFIGINFIFLTGLFKLLGQIKEMVKIIIIKMEGDIEKGEN